MLEPVSGNFKDGVYKGVYKFDPTNVYDEVDIEKLPVITKLFIDNYITDKMNKDGFIEDNKNLSENFKYEVENKFPNVVYTKEGLYKDQYTYDKLNGGTVNGNTGLNEVDNSRAVKNANESVGTKPINAIRKTNESTTVPSTNSANTAIRTGRGQTKDNISAQGGLGKYSQNTNDFKIRSGKEKSSISDDMANKILSYVKNQLSPESYNKFVDYIKKDNITFSTNKKGQNDYTIERKHVNLSVDAPGNVVIHEVAHDMVDAIMHDNNSKKAIVSKELKDYTKSILDKISTDINSESGEKVLRDVTADVKIDAMLTRDPNMLAIDLLKGINSDAPVLDKMAVIVKSLNNIETKYKGITNEILSHPSLVHEILAYAAEAHGDGKWETNILSDLYDMNKKAKVGREFISNEANKPLARAEKLSRQTEREQVKKDAEKATVNSSIESITKKYLKDLQDKLDLGKKLGINVIAHQTKDIKNYNLKKMLESKSTLIRHEAEDWHPLLRLGKATARRSNELKNDFIKKMDSAYDLLSNKKEEETLHTLQREIDTAGREYAQPVRLPTKSGEDKYTIITRNNGGKDDIYETFKDSSEAENRAKELQAEGMKVYQTYLEGNELNPGYFQVIGTNNNLKVYNSFDVASKLAKDQSETIAKNNGIASNIWNAYSIKRELFNEIHTLKQDVDLTTGVDQKDSHKYRWGYMPRVNKRWGVYIENRDINGNVFHTAVDSFDSRNDAIHEANRLKGSGDDKFSVVERGIKIDQAATPANEHYDILTDEQMQDYQKNKSKLNPNLDEAFNNFGEVKKVIDNGMKDVMSRQEFVNLLADRKSIKKNNPDIDIIQYQNELNSLDIMKFIKSHDSITKNDALQFFNKEGGHKRDRFNISRKNSEGYSKDQLNSDYQFIMASANHIATAPFYNMATRAYKAQFGHDITSDIKKSDTEDLISSYIHAVVGTPNHLDATLNRLVSELPVVGEFIRNAWGDQATTNALNKTMQTMALLKLGMFRPTAAIAQYGTLINIAAKTGYTSEFGRALKLGFKTPARYDELMKYCGIGDEFQGMESEHFGGRGSIFRSRIGNVKVGDIMKKSLYFFSKADAATRKVAAIYAYDKAIREGKSKEDALEAGSDFATLTNFDYDKTDNPGLFDKGGTLAATIMQFKKYGIKELEFMANDLHGAEMARFLGSYALAAGLLGFPLMGVWDAISNQVLGKSITDVAKEYAMTKLPHDKLTQGLIGTALYGLGSQLPNKMGVDFSRSIGLSDLLPTDSQQLFGPTFSTIGDAIHSFQNNTGASNIILGMAKALSPELGNFYQASTGKGRDWKKGVDTYTYSSGERVMKLLGFRPIRESIENDKAWAMTNANNQYHTGKSKAILAFIQQPSSKNWQIVQNFGGTKKDVEKAKENLTKTNFQKAEATVPSKKKGGGAENLRSMSKSMDTFTGTW